MATPKPELNVSTVLSNMKTEHVQCRDFGHTWRPYGAQWLPAERCYEERLRCSRCRTVRNRLISQRGELLRSHYEYADNYLIAGFGRFDDSDRCALRLASLELILPTDTDEEAG